MFINRLWITLVAAAHLLRVYMQMIYGVFKISKLDAPVVTIFGGSRFSQTDPYAKEAHKLAALFINDGISVLTGGGPGIMEATSCGAIPPASHGKGKSIGIGVVDLEPANKCLHEFFYLRYFFARKWLLTRFSQAFVVFPGGFGTMDELYEILVLIQAKKMKKVPVILVGAEYWKLWLQWLNDEMLGHKLILPEDMNIFSVTDSLDEVLCLVRDQCKPKKKEL